MRTGTTDGEEALAAAKRAAGWDDERDRRDDVEELAARLLVSIFGTDNEWREEDGLLVARRAFKIAEAFMVERDKRRKA